MKNGMHPMLPMDCGVRIAEDEPVRKLIEICETLNYTKLLSTYERQWKKIHPITLFELIVCGYMNGRYSSREIEESCRNDIRFMWILQG